jgi:Uma2 family endonuclease
MASLPTARSYPLAPWAEVVPDASYPMTTDELHAMPDDGWSYELVDGTLLRMLVSSFGASRIGMRLASRLSIYKAPQLAPDLAVEVASENQYAPGMGAKAKTYLRFGTRLVWIIWPRYKRMDVWHPGDEAPTALGIEDTLDGEDVVPGFTYRVARLFP